MEALQQLQDICATPAFAEWERLRLAYEAALQEPGEDGAPSVAALRKRKAELTSQMASQAAEAGAGHHERCAALLGSWLTEEVAAEVLGDAPGELLLMSEVKIRQSVAHATSEFDLMLVRAYPPGEPPGRLCWDGSDRRAKAIEAALVRSAGRSRPEPTSLEVLHAEVLAVVECKASASQIKDHIPVIMAGLGFYSAGGFTSEQVFLKGSHKLVLLDSASFARFRDRQVERLVYMAGHDHFATLALRKIVVDELLRRGAGVLRHDGTAALDEKFRSRISWTIEHMAARAREASSYMEAVVEHGNLWFLEAESGQHAMAAESADLPACAQAP